MLGLFDVEFPAVTEMGACLEAMLERTELCDVGACDPRKGVSPYNWEWRCRTRGCRTIDLFDRVFRLHVLSLDRLKPGTGG